MRFLATYESFVTGVRLVLFVLGIAIALACAVDWAVRTRKINPFSRVARFFRGQVDPLMAPVERILIRAGGSPGATPWWSLALFAVGGIALISILQLAGSILSQAMFAAADPRSVPTLLLSWAFSLLKLALLVRVVSSWLPISPSSPWIRWAFVATEWFLAPLRRVIPRMGMLDLTPMIAWFGLVLLQGVFAIP